MKYLQKNNELNRNFNRNLYQWLVFTGLTLGLWLKGFYTQFSIKINKVPIFHEDHYPMFWLSLAMVVTVMTLLFMMGRKRPLVWPLIGAVLLGALMFADTIYGRYYYNPVSMSLLDQLYMAGDVSGSAFSLLKPKDVIFVLDFVAIGLFRLLLEIFPVTFVGDGHGKRRLVAQILLLTVGLGGFFYGYNETDKTHYAYERKYIARDLGLLYYHGYDFGKFVERKMGRRTLNEEEQRTVEAALHPSASKNSYTGKAKGYNLIVIQMEAIMDYLIDYEVEGKAVMPYLSSLKEESLYLSNCYVQTANGNTVDAELMMNTSLLPAATGAVYYEYPTNTYKSLPLALKEKGYAVNSFHAYEASFWNREVMHKTLGFDRLYSFDDFVMEEKIGWALSDASFLKQSMAFTEAARGENPFYSFMVTLSSHHPYDGTMKGPFTQAKGTEGVVNWYYNGANYVDGVLEGFIQDLKDAGLYDQTVLVIYGDHGGLFGDDARKQCDRDKTSYEPKHWIHYQQVPVIVHAPGILDDGHLIETATGQVDIMPTVANLLGIEGLYTIGQDVLAEGYDSLVVRRYGDVMTDDFTYLSDQGEVYDNTSGEVVAKEAYQEIIDRAYKKLEASDLILVSDWFGR